MTDDDHRYGRQRAGEAQGDDDVEPPSMWEWIVGVASSIVVLTAVGFLLVEAFAGPSGPPVIAVHVERIQPAGAGYLVEIRAVNSGDETAANLTIEGALIRDSTAVETSTVTIDFVPAETERGGGLFFTRDPAEYRLEVRPMGYDQP